MTLHFHFPLKISVDLFASLELTLSAQPSFENLKEFGLICTSACEGRGSQIISSALIF
jgi:hypothetical protein